MENLTGVSMREYANFIYAPSTRTASRNSSNFRSHLSLFVQCWTYEGRKGKQGIMFFLRPGLTSEWSVFKKLCILLFACLPSPSARRRREEKSSASTILTRETSYAYCLCHQKKDYIYMQVCPFFPVIFFIGRNRLD